MQLLTVPQACGQEWSHLIFAGWNDGVWPPPAGGEFAREEEIAAFNQKIFQLNARATRRGRQGEGHISVREGHTFYLGPVEQRAIALRQFKAVALRGHRRNRAYRQLVQEGEPERFGIRANCLRSYTLKRRSSHLRKAPCAHCRRARAAGSKSPLA